MLENLERYRPEGHAKTWLFTIALNLSRNSARRQRYRNHLSIDQVMAHDDDDREPAEWLLRDTSASLDEATDQKELLAWLKGVVNELPERDRQVLLLCSIEGLSYDVVASILHMSASNVGVVLCRVRKKLLEKVAQWSSSVAE